MKHIKSGIVLLALLLAAMAMIPVASAAGSCENAKDSGIASPYAYFLNAEFCSTSSGAYTVQFWDYSSGIPPVTSYSWNFGDGATSTQANPSHVYSPGTYTVSLTVWNWFETDTTTKANYVTVDSNGTVHIPVCL
jgi:PKD repeat protein